MAPRRTQAELDTILRSYNPEDVYRMLARLSQKHAAKSRFRGLPYNPRFDFHRPDNVGFAPIDPAISNGELHPYGPAVHDGFSVIYAAWQNLDYFLSIMAGEMRMHGRNFTLVTNHGALFDIALVLGALRLNIATKLPAIEFSRHSTLIVSAGVRTLEVAVEVNGVAVVMPAIEVLRFYTHVLASFPTTFSVKGINFDPELVKASNELVRILHEEKLQAGGQIIAMAPSASEDRLLSNGKHMQPLKNGTMELMIGTWAIPVAVTLDGDEPPACKVLEPRWIEGTDDCHDMMDEVAHQCHRQSLVPHIYHRTPNLYQRALSAYEKRVVRDKRRSP